MAGSMEIRTRFAPSPTGLLHIGGVRTALFEVLLAHHYHGQAILRIDDTDRERFVPGAIRSLMEDLQWLGLHFDEGPSKEELPGEDLPAGSNLCIGGPSGPYVQSLRAGRHRQIAERLVESRHAYRCDCSPEKLQRERDDQAAKKQPIGYSGYCRNREVPAGTPHVVRFLIPQHRSLSFVDGVKGKITWDRIILRDPVLLKSDGLPTYHLATVVDDHDMRISHVLRGDEWLPSTPLHLLLFEALGWQPPVFAHLPQVLGEDGKKLSKRHGATFLRSFREAGYLPEAILNFMALIGWSPGEGETENIFSLDELTRRFSLDHVNNAGAVFSYEKLKWMNGVYIRKLQNDDLHQRVRPFLISAGLEIDDEKLRRIIPHVRQRLELLADVVPLLDFLFRNNIDRDLSAILKKGVDAALAGEICVHTAKALADLNPFVPESIESSLRGVAEDLATPIGPVLGVIRIAITGKKVTPPLFESIYALGKASSVSRLKETADLLGNCGTTK